MIILEIWATPCLRHAERGGLRQMQSFTEGVLRMVLYATPCLRHAERGGQRHKRTGVWHDCVLRSKAPQISTFKKFIF